MGIDDLARNLFRNTARFGAFFGMKAYLSREDIRGLDHLDLPGPKIVAANHYGGKLDSMILWTYLTGKVGTRAAFPGKKELFAPSVTLLGMNREILTACGAIPVDRENPGTIIDEFVKALGNNGKYDGVLSIHFEGKTTPKGMLVGKAKTGFARAALRLPAEHSPLVIPTSVSYKKGTYHTLPAFRAHATVELLTPIDISDYKRRYGMYNPGTAETKEQHAVAEELAERVRGLVVEDLQRKGVPTAPGIPYGVLP